MSRLIKNTMLYSIGEIAPKIIAFLLLPIYTIYLSPADYGVISYTSSVCLFLFILGTLSLNSFVLRYYFIRQTQYERAELIGNIFLTILIVNSLILLLAFCFLPGLIRSFEIQIPWDPYFRMAVIINFLESFSIVSLAYFRIEQKAGRFISLTLGRTVLQVGLTLLFVVFLRKGLIGYYNALLYTLIPYALINTLIILRQGILRLNFAEIKEGLVFSLPLLPGAISYYILSLFDRIILERSVDLSMVGIYNVAATIALSLNIVIQSGYKAVEPEIFKRHGTHMFVPFVMKCQKYFFTLVYIAGFALAMFSQEIFHFMMSERFYQGYRLVPILIVGVVMTGQNVIYSGVLSAECRTKVVGGATMLGAAVSLTFNLLFIPVWGVYAAAVSSACAFFVMNTVLYIKMPLEGKSCVRENMCVLLLALVSITYTYVFAPDISLGSFTVKLALFVLYTIFACRLMGIKRISPKSLLRD